MHDFLSFTNHLLIEDHIRNKDVHETVLHIGLLHVENSKFPARTLMYGWIKELVIGLGVQLQPSNIEIIMCMLANVHDNQA